ncbi:hypothetical protein [Bacillus mesophilum]|nr:hypothetical protein [Bacillus mesophilum]
MEGNLFIFLAGLGTVVIMFTPVIYKLNKRISNLEEKINQSKDISS